MAQSTPRGSQLLAGSITDTQINAAAGIASTKLAAWSADRPAGGFKLTNLGTPSAGTDAATKAYVDAIAQGLDVKASVRAASPLATNITLSGTQTIDGVALSVGDRVLVKNNSTASQNGIWVVAAGAWSRATDADVNAEVTSGLFVFVTEGTENGNTGWSLTTDDPIVVGTTALVFSQFSGAGTYIPGFGMELTGNAFSVKLDSDGGIFDDGNGALTIGLWSPGALHHVGIGLLAVNFDGVTIGINGSDQLKVNYSFATREVPTGALNGSNTSFVLANTPIAGSEQVFLNGILQHSGAGNDYTISGATITYLTAPISTDRILVSYRY